MSTASFYKWRKKLDDPHANTCQHAPSDQQHGFANVQINYPETTTVVVELPGGTRLMLPTADPAVLQSLLAAITRHDARQARRDPQKQGAQSC